LLGAAVLLLPACKNSNPVGEGKGPTSVKVTYNGSDALQTVECSTTQLAATATFEGDNGSSESDVTTRVAWTSSNPGVIDISNGDIETFPGSGSFFATGTVIARTTGTAIIRAAYADALFATFSVEADAIGSLRISPALTKMAPNSVTTFALYVQPQTDQLEQNLTTSAVWTVPTSSSAASLTGTSTVQAYGTPLNSNFILEAHLYTCDRTVSQTMQLGAVSGLTLNYEQPTASAVPLIINDAVRVEAKFTDTSAPAQNLSDQVDVATATGYASDIATTSVGAGAVIAQSDGTTVLGSDTYLLVAGSQKNKPVMFKLTYDQSGLNLVTYTREYTFADIDITSLRIDPTSFTLQYPNLGHLYTYGTFEDGVERPITRYTSWSTTTTDLLTVEGSGNDGGLLTPANLSGTARVYASVTSSVQGDLEENIKVDVLKQD
ncbi:MAG: hypothetical protein ACREVL_03515, partial [Solimonas sp.]